MKQIRIQLQSAIVLMVVLLLVTAGAAYAEVGVMGKDLLKEKLSSPNLIVLDVRSGKDWSASEFKIKGAHRVDPKSDSEWENRFAKDKTIVLYCA